MSREGLLNRVEGKQLLRELLFRAATSADSGRNRSIPSHKDATAPRYQTCSIGSAAVAVDHLPHQAFDERHLEHLFVLDGAVTKVPILAEQLAMVRGDRDVGVRGHGVEEFFDHAV